MASLKKELEELNLNPKEVAIYLALLELGEASIERIAHKSNIKRTTVYDVIASLKDKGLVGLTKQKKRTIYYAEDPRVLETQLEEKMITMQRILPELLSLTNAIERKPKIRYFEGWEGIKNVYKDTLRYPNREILMWGSAEVFTEFDLDFMLDYYLVQRVKKRISMRAIGPDIPRVRAIAAQDKRYLRETRLTPYHHFPFEVEINLYGAHSIGIMAFKEQMGLIIESKKISTTLKSIFELNWMMLKSQ